MRVRAIVTDIEGTTSAISFVHQTLFPYAARALPDYVRSHAEEHRKLLEAVRSEAGEPEADLERVIAILLEWTGEDRKATSLKALQGHIWTHGYETGAFSGHVYPDAAEMLRHWHAKKIRLYVYSSGSVKAQQLLFRHSDFGDLTHVFSGHFDTTTGPKREASSYRKIAAKIGGDPGDILFLSDVAEELDAAAEADLQTIQLVRDDTVKIGRHATAARFDALPIAVD